MNNDLRAGEPNELIHPYEQDDGRRPSVQRPPTYHNPCDQDRVPTEPAQNNNPDHQYFESLSLHITPPPFTSSTMLSFYKVFLLAMLLIAAIAITTTDAKLGDCELVPSKNQKDAKCVMPSPSSPKKGMHLGKKALYAAKFASRAATKAKRSAKARHRTH
ncbi:hypothetical protein HDU96_006091 [Phlyctochytrium bullatum]|nr:hypothetical protein HDU96_006091 [Phlyctochytrium bullatum]